MSTITITRGRAGVAPLTWGQRSILRVMLMLGDDVRTTNVGSWEAMPDGTTVEEATHWITHLVQVYETIRTRYLQADGDWIQVLDGDGSFEVEVMPVDPASLADIAWAAQSDMRKERFDIAGEWQIRFRILADQDRALAVAWAGSHILADLRGMWNLDAALKQIGGELTAGIQPLDQAAFEASAAGQNTDRLAADYWRKQIDLAAGHPRQAAERPSHQGFRFWHASFESPALSAALARLSQEYRTTSSVVLFAAVNAAVGAVLSVDRVTMTLVAANRSRRETRSAVGTFSQLVPVTLDLGADWTDLIRRAGVLSVSALGRGAYDPRSIAAIKDEKLAELGALPDLSMSFNDIRGSLADTPAPELNPDDRGEVLWQDRRNEGDSTLYFWVSGRDKASCKIALMVDTHVLSPDDGDAVLLGIERRLIDEAIRL